MLGFSAGAAEGWTIGCRVGNQVGSAIGVPDGVAVGLVDGILLIVGLALGRSMRLMHTSVYSKSSNIVPLQPGKGSSMAVR